MMAAERLTPGKYRLSGLIELQTGLHIGGSNETSEIGSVDKSVIRDPLTREPYIPGSSLKGKLRALLELYHYAQDTSFFSDAKIRVIRVSGKEIRHHECGDPRCVVCRLFGATSGRNGRRREHPVDRNRPGRLIVRDTVLTEEARRLLQASDELSFYMTEVKFENTLDRITSTANPRQIERVPKGTTFRFEMIYTVWGDGTMGDDGQAVDRVNEMVNERAEEKKNGQDPDRLEAQIRDDLYHLLLALDLLESDYLGGNGSRGYGQLLFKDMKLEARSIDAYRTGENWETLVQGRTLAAFSAAFRERFSA